MIRVLFTVNGLRVNGMSSVILQYIQNLNCNEYSFSIFTDEIDPFYLPALKERKVKIIQSKMRRRNPVVYYYELLKVIKEGQYDIIHAHGNSATIAVEMVAAKQCGVPVRIAHSHNTTCDYKMIDKLLRPLFYASYTHGVGCGVEAGRWLFGKRPHIIIKNGIDLDRFKFNPERRSVLRKELGIDEKTVLGHVGRFTDQKNHKFLLMVFKEYLIHNGESVLLLVGDGPLENSVKTEAENFGIADRVVFYGTAPNTEDFYSAIDCFVFPSKYEGVPLTLVEAQANGLPCIISDKVSPEVIQTDLITVKELHTPEEWAASIMSIDKRFTEKSAEAIKALESAGFGIKSVISQVDSLYKAGLREALERKTKKA